jgi:hypothetical protein
MNSRDCATTIAAPIGLVGMSFYFSPQAIAIGETIELDIVTFYGAGRGGVLGDVEVTEVDEVFFFFKEGVIAGLMEAARAGAPRELAVSKHLEASSVFARDTFGGIDAGVLEAFSAAAESLMASVPKGSWPIVDGYLLQPAPSDSVAAAYRWAVILREVRGGVHTDAVKAEGLSDLEAVQFDNGGAMLGLHGYADEDRVEETDEIVARRQAVEDDTDARMEAVLDVLSDSQRDALAAGALAMLEALGAPTPVA